MNARKIAESNLIFRCVSGSKSYGTDSEHSDTDIRGVFIAPPKIAFDCFQGLDQVEYSERDEVLYELRKFVKLAAEANPNIIELLFTDEENILFIDPAFAQLREHRQLFLSKKAKFTFSGYAMAQMKRIKGHNKWIENPQPEESPELLSFATLILPNGDVVPGHSVESFVNVFLVKVNATTFRVFAATNFSKPPLSADRKNIQYIDVDVSRLDQAENLEFYGTLIVQQETYRIQHRMWKDYWGWKKNRNEARAKLEEHHGFDTKHAMHLMRLLRMSHEILREGKVIVRRPDAQDLLAIRDGSFNYAQLVETAERMDAELDDLYEASTLPHTADKEAINDLYIQVVRDYWHRVGQATII